MDELKKMAHLEKGDLEDVFLKLTEEGEEIKGIIDEIKGVWIDNE